MSMKTLSILLAVCFLVNGLPYGLPYGTEVLYGNIKNDPRETRSFKNFIQATSRNAVEIAKLAARTFFPSSSNKFGVAGNKRMIRSNADKAIKMDVNRIQSEMNETKNKALDNKSVISNGEQKKSTPEKQVVAAYPSFPVFFYPAGYFPYAYPQQQSINQNQDISKRSGFPYNFMYNYAQYFANQQNLPNADSNNVKENKVSENSNVLSMVNKETDGFAEAVTEMMEASLSKNNDGGVDLEEKYHDKEIDEKSNKRNTVKATKTTKDAIKALKRVLDTRGSLEQKMVNYFTDYICGKDC